LLSLTQIGLYHFWLLCYILCTTVDSSSTKFCS